MELKHCPFCGGKAEMKECESGQAAGFVPLYLAECSECLCCAYNWHTTEAEAIAAWNTRANHAQGEPVAWRYERKAPWPAMYYHEERAPEHLSGDTDYPWIETPLYTHPPAQDVAELVSTLEWYAETVENCNSMTDDAARVSLAADLGRRARTALAKFGEKP